MTLHRHQNRHRPNRRRRTPNTPNRASAAELGSDLPCVPILDTGPDVVGDGAPGASKRPCAPHRRAVARDGDPALHLSSRLPSPPASRTVRRPAAGHLFEVGGSRHAEAPHGWCARLRRSGARPRQLRLPRGAAVRLITHKAGLVAYLLSRICYSVASGTPRGCAAPRRKAMVRLWTLAACVIVFTEAPLAVSGQSRCMTKWNPVVAPE